MSGEDRLIAWLRGRLRRLGEDHLGDDAALLDRPERFAISTDQQIEGVHFLSGLDPRRIGARLVAVCLSDLAASGAVPAYGFLTVAVPESYDVRRLLSGVLSACSRHGLTLAGGDTATTTGPVSLSLTVLGRRAPRGRWLTRDCARAGDSIWVGGALGASAVGRHLLAAGAHLQGRSVHLPARFHLPKALQADGRRAVRTHLEPTPQLELGATLARRQRVAALDLSDGLAIDLHRLCAASGVGAELVAHDLPVAPGVDRWSSALGLRSDRLVLAGGEDYVLLFTLPRGSRAPAGCHRIGGITAKRTVRMRDGSRSRTLPPSGWDHLRASADGR